MTDIPVTIWLTEPVQFNQPHIGNSYLIALIVSLLSYVYDPYRDLEGVTGCVGILPQVHEEGKGLG